MEEYNQDLCRLLKSFPTWHTAVVYSNFGVVIAATERVNVEFIKPLLYLFEDRDTTITHGIQFMNQAYAVHQWYPNMIFGRSGNWEEGNGVAVIKIKPNDVTSGEVLYLAVMYELPTLSAQVIPEMVQFANIHLGEVYESPNMLSE